MKLWRWLVILALLVAGSACSPLTPSPWLGVERRGDVLLLVAVPCADERLEEIGLGPGDELEGDHTVRLQLGDLELRDGAFEFELNGLLPPTEERDSVPSFPFHIKTEWSGGAAYTFVSTSPRDGTVRYQARQDDGVFEEVEVARSAFMRQAEAKCREVNS